MSNPRNPHSIIGYLAKDVNECLIGDITNAYTEGNKMWAVINDDYEIDATCCQFVFNLTDGSIFVRFN